MAATSRSGLRLTPFHVAALGFFGGGLLLAAYNGLQAVDLVSTVSWIGWSHVHFVTVGGFTQLLFGMLPQFAARKLDQPAPGRRAVLGPFAGLNGGFAAIWYGRAFGRPAWFDLGTILVFVTVLAVLGSLLAMGWRSERRWWRDVTVRTYVAALTVFLAGIVYAFGLFSHPVDVPGGLDGLREAHVHANGWGFLGLAAIATLYDLFPRLVDADLYSERLRAYSSWLFIAGIVPLITGPWLGLGRTVTAPGLVLYASGFLLYGYTLVKTYLAGTGSGVAQSVLAAQVWVLGPASFAPFILFGVPLGIESAWIEQGALHFFFLGWALPIAMAGLLVTVRTLPCLHDDATEGQGTLSDMVPRDGTLDVLPTWMVGTWNGAVFLTGLGFFFQNQPIATQLFGVGWTVILLIWGYQLGQIIAQRRPGLAWLPGLG
ncbi:cbb3-type cytochrome c oxidase subunit I [Halorientalis brevis]|uniref:Cbb3-type cytochrome c oxidase subunit I n=1 Tax=Halorientalis brevis TaxID=1126241 RepID=A0ABD6CCW4_9EURY|nr:cbb3-type cytochrome c oxidase subunit I [Halorientalis brevis]